MGNPVLPRVIDFSHQGTYTACMHKNRQFAAALAVAGVIAIALAIFAAFDAAAVPAGTVTSSGAAGATVTSGEGEQFDVVLRGGAEVGDFVSLVYQPGVGLTAAPARQPSTAPQLALAACGAACLSAAAFFAAAGRTRPRQPVQRRVAMR